MDFINLNIIINDYVFSTVIFFIISYLFSFSMLCILLLIVDSSKIVYLSSLNKIVSVYSLRIPLILVLFNLAGVPPTPMFLIKISLINLLFKLSATVLALFTFTFNLFAMAFYLQTIRYVVNFKSTYALVFKNNYVYLNYKVCLIFSTLVLLSFSFLFISDDLINILSSLIF